MIFLKNNFNKLLDTYLEIDLLLKAMYHSYSGMIPFVCK